MIELLTANTPNGKKISIMLEEIKFDYKVTKINILKDEQFKPEFKKISPFSKIPVIIDHDNKTSLFESGAILIYLGERSKKFYDIDDRLKISSIVRDMRQQVDDMSRELLDLRKTDESAFNAILTEEGLKETIAENIGIYGTRIYRAFMDDGTFLEFTSELDHSLNRLLKFYTSVDL